MPYQMNTNLNITFRAGTMYPSNIDPAKLQDAVERWAQRKNHGIDLRIFPDGSLRGWEHPYFEKKVYAGTWLEGIIDLANFVGKAVKERMTVAYGPAFINGAVVMLNLDEAVEHARLFNSADLQLFLGTICPVTSSLEVIHTHGYGGWSRPNKLPVRSEKAIEIAFDRVPSTEKLIEAAERLGQTTFYLLNGRTVTVFDQET